ncbi:MAG: peptidase M17 [Bacteroidales bacterium]|nr:peptidase M17 [Bacteroidales bacterium]
MIPIISRITEMPADQSVVVVCGAEHFPSFLDLGEVEAGYVKRCIAEREEVIVLNNYYRIIVIVTEKSDLAPLRRMEHLRQLSARVREIVRDHRVRSLTVAHTVLCEGSFEAFTEGLIMSLYTFNRHKTLSRKEKRDVFPESLSFFGENETGWIEIFRDAIYFARDLVNEPVSHLTAAVMADRIKDFVSQAGIRCDVYGMRKIEALKMGGVLAVNRGSLDPPAFIVMEWKPEGHINTRPVILVGKGVVFDTGGVNLKPGEHMDEMKADMAGGAAVASAMYMSAKKGIPLHIMAFVPASDNRPGVRAYVPGDVITMYNGTTVEVVNTDAEGRLLVADALSYADNFDPSLVVTLATLTGSAANTFGSHAIAMMGNADSETKKMMEMAGEKVYERVASLPFWEEYGDMLKSDIADLRNLGGKEAGAVTAGKFLEKFTITPLIHLDIAGTAMMKKDEHYRLKGGTGSGARLLTSFLEALATSEMKL